MTAPTGEADPQPVRVERFGGIARVVIDNPPVNASNRAVRAGLLDAISEVDQDPSLACAVLIGAGRAFIAGSDLSEFDGEIPEPELPRVIEAIERSSKPFVAAIHGAALGGGFELALACDGRVASPDATVGLPEATLGILPGAGGVPRLLRAIGPSATARLAATGARISADEALSLGAINAIASGDLFGAAAEFAEALGGAKRRLRDRPVFHEPADQLERVVEDVLRKRPAPGAAESVEAVRRGVRLTFEDAVDADRRAFNAMRVSPRAVALRRLFFAERAAHARLKLGDGGLSEVAVVGAGTMGVGVAAAFAAAGRPVRLIDQSSEALDRACASLRAMWERDARAGRCAPEEIEERLERIYGSTDLAAARGAPLLIEAVFEEIDVKRRLVREIEALDGWRGVIASNTSYLSIGTVAEGAARPDRVVGLHFFNPVTRISVVEVVRGAKTSDAAMAAAYGACRSIGKTPIPCRDVEGFAGNRIYSAYRREAEILLEDGAYPEEVDAAAEAFGFAMGPFQVADLSGLDVAWRMRRRRAATRDPAERYVRIADMLCEQGRFGKKVGAGWHRHPDGARRGEPDPEVRRIIEAERERIGVVARRLSREEIQERLACALAEEAEAVVDQAIVESAGDADLLMVKGYGYPAEKGGPIHWAFAEGAAAMRRHRAEAAVAGGAQPPGLAAAAKAARPAGAQPPRK